VDLGPNAVLGLAREGYMRTDASWKDIKEMMSYDGSWKLARHNVRVGYTELLGSISKRVYTRRARTYIPELSKDDLVSVPAGVRAQAVARDGSLVDDFVLRRRGDVLAVRNAPSPAATASLAIAEHIIDNLLDAVVPQ
jgi:L-2-hydroxyglutarate oxidase LhgO